MTGVQKICIVGIVFGILLSEVPLLAQVQTTGVPESFKLTEKSAILIPSATLDSIYPQKMISEDKQLGILNRYGVVEPTVIDIKKEGVATKIKDRGTIWRYQFDSPDAYSLGVNFQSFHIPEKASLFIYNPEREKVAGAFTSINNKESKLFTLADFKGGSVILEYFEPDSAEYSGEVIIGSVTLAYRAQTAAATSRIGVNCPTGDDWQVEKNSVCRMTFNDGRYSYLCSGALINNVREDGTPYFLTANHCLSTSSEASTLVTYFNYENSTCSSNDASLNHSLSGATLKATLAGSDFTLLLLDENPPSAYKPYFAGWDASGDNPESGVCIHHPEGTPKCISVDQDKIYDNTTLISWDNHTYSALHSHWDVQFDVGNIEEGSSGGPLFDQNKRIVGQLHGGSDTDNFYGKLSVSWASSTTATKQLKAWLDPDGTGVKTLDGMGTNVSPKAKFTTQITKACTNNPVQLTDKSLYSPKKWLWKITPLSYQFVNQTDSTTRNPVVEFLTESLYSVELIASNDYGSDSALATNYIDARNQLDVKFQSVLHDSTLCGCDVANLSLVASGAYTYSFALSENKYLTAESSSDTLSLSLTDQSKGIGNFDAWVKLTGTHGTCSAVDTLFLHLLQQKNDDISNAAELHLGRNANCTNHCGSVENDEVSPYSGNCYSQVSWCSGETGGALNNTVWYSFYGPASGVITLDSHGFDDQLAIYSSTSGSDEFSSFSDLKQLAANDNRSSSDVTARISDLTVVPGQKYWVQLDGRSGAYGDATLDLISNSVEVYPTASSDGQFTVYIATSEEGDARYEVYNPIGQKIYSQTAAITLDNSAVNLDLGFCPRGVYLLSVKMGDISSVQKIVKK